VSNHVSVWVIQIIDSLEEQYPQILALDNRNDESKDVYPEFLKAWSELFIVCSF
jgi:hypothetical protein